MCPLLGTSLTESVKREKGNLKKLQQNEKGDIRNLRTKIFFFFLFMVIATTSFRCLGICFSFFKKKNIYASVYMGYIVYRAYRVLAEQLAVKHQAVTPV